MQDQNPIGKALAQSNIANLYTETHKFDLAEKNLRESLSVLQNKNTKEGLRICYQNLYALYQKKENTKRH